MERGPGHDDRRPEVWDASGLEAPHAQPDKALRVRRMFEAIAPTYELVNTLASLGRDAGWRREMRRLAEVAPGDVLLDVACGTGDVARTFAAGRPAPRLIAGVDFAAGMLARAAARRTCRTAFVLGDALRLPIADASVQIVTCAFGIRNFRDLAAGLREMRRVLAGGGRAVLLEFSVPRGPLLRRLYLTYFTRIMPRLATLISGDRTGAYRYLPRSVVGFESREGIVEALISAGFARVEVRTLTLGIVAVYVARVPS